MGLPMVTMSGTTAAGKSHTYTIGERKNRQWIMNHHVVLVLCLLVDGLGPSAPLEGAWCLH